MGAAVRREGAAAGVMSQLHVTSIHVTYSDDMIFAASEQPAGGAALDQVALASGSAALLTVLLLLLGWGHRRGRIGALAAAAGFLARRTGLPGWVALPSVVAGISLVLAVFGMYWDIALHIGVGRDEGPLANPAHYFILAGLFGIFAAGFLAIVLPLERVSAAGVQVGEGWHAPLGGVLIVAAAAFALLGFPLDDIWHRLFGQDVTLWGPTHLMLIGGASLTLLGMAVLLVEGGRSPVGDRLASSAGAERGSPAGAARSADGRLAATGPRPWIQVARRVVLCGAFLLGLSTFQAEFDFGVPQFRFVFQPLLIMLAAGAGLVAVRIWAGRGAALGAVAFFLAIRGLLALLVGPVLGETTPHFPLYLVEALVVEAIALRRGLVRRPLAFALWAGLGIGTVGLAVEWAWTHVWMPLPWPRELLPEAALFGVPTAFAGALIGAWIGERLSGGSARAARYDARLSAAAVGSLAVLAVLIGLALYKPAAEGVAARVALTELPGPGGREVAATIQLDPPTAADGAEWLTVTAWQGGGLVVDRLRAVGPGRFETTLPIPVHGTWKALVRMHRGTTLSALPIFMPEDRAIPAEEVPAPPRFERTFVADYKLLQREQRTAAGWLWGVAYGVVLVISIALLITMAWGLSRLSRAAADGDPDPDPPARPAGAARGAPSGVPGPAGAPGGPA